LLNLFIRLCGAPLAVLFGKAYDVTLGCQVAFYTSLLQFAQIVFGGNAVFLIDFPVFLLQFPDGFFFLLLGATFIEGLELLL